MKLPFGKQKQGGGAPAAPQADRGRTWEDATGEAPAKGPAPQAAPKAGKPKKQGGGCSIGFLLIMGLLILFFAGGAYALLTQKISLPGGNPLDQAANAPEPTTDILIGSLPTSEPPDVADVPKPTARARRTRTPSAAAELPGLVTPTAAVIGESLPPVAAASAPAVNGCGGTPQFLAKLKITDPVFSVDEPGTRGLFLTGTSAEGQLRYQHQSWSGQGYMQAFVMDGAGNIYLAPSARTGPGISAPPPQDRILKVDTRTGELKPYLTLPAAGPVSAENPHGVMGLAIDCESNSLYVTSVTGSSAAAEVGRLFRVDVKANAVAGQLEKVDGYGAAVLAGAAGKQLVFGSARDASIRAVDLDAGGNFQGEPRVVAQLQEPERAKEIWFTENGQMVVRSAAFTYAEAEAPAGGETQWQLDPASGMWTPAQ